MTIKDYKVIAHAIRTWPNNEAKQSLVKHLAGYLQYDNPRFNIAKFATACGVEMDK